MAGISAGNLPGPILMAWALGRTLRACIGSSILDGTPKTLNGAHVSGRACARHAQIGSGAGAPLQRWPRRIAWMPAVREGTGAATRAGCSQLSGRAAWSGGSRDNRRHTSRNSGAPGLGMCGHRSTPSAPGVAASLAGVPTSSHSRRRRSGSLVQRPHAGAAGRAIGGAAQRLVSMGRATVRRMA